MARYKLLAVESDTKTRKGTSKGFLTGIVYFAPHTIASKKTLCPFASEGCIKDCLFNSGLSQVFPHVNEGRIRKTRYFLENIDAFKDDLRSDIKALKREARERDLIPVIRLNGTSDILIERVFADILAEFSEIQFYDYTKIPVRHRARRPSNYHLTFSLSENNRDEAFRAIDSGINVAVVFKTQLLPTTFWGRPVIDGGVSDLRFLDGKAFDGKGLIVGLYVKGNKARKNPSAFVQNNNGQ